MFSKALNRNVIGRRRLQLLVRLLRTSRGHKDPDLRMVRGALGLEEPTPFVSLRRSVARAFRARANPPCAMRLSVAHPTHRPTVAKALTLSLRSEPVLARRAVIDVPQFTSRSEAGPETINAWIVASQPNAPELSRGAHQKRCGRQAQRASRFRLARRRLQLLVRPPRRGLERPEEMARL